MREKSLLCTWIVIACLATGLTLYFAGQTATTGALTGTVTDPTGAVIPGVAVTATNTQTGMERAVNTTENGSYRFSLLPLAATGQLYPYWL